jgi:hypothetical protein
LRTKSLRSLRIATRRERRAATLLDAIFLEAKDFTPGLEPVAASRR